MHDVLTTMRKSFAVLFPSARSPFVVTVLIEILNEAVEKSIEAGVEGRYLILHELNSSTNLLQAKWLPS